MKDKSGKLLTVEVLEKIVTYHLGDECQKGKGSVSDIRLVSIKIKNDDTYRDVDVEYETLCSSCQKGELHYSGIHDIQEAVDKYVVKISDVNAFEEAAKKIEELGD